VADEASGGSHKILIRQALLLRLDSQFSLSLLAVGTPATIHPMAVAEKGRWSQAQTSIDWMPLIGCLACSVERRADNVISDGDPGLEEESRDLFDTIQQNHRPWQGYWYWRDKPVMEQAVAREILTQAGLELCELRSRDAGEDPPDCEAIINGQHWDRGNRTPSPEGAGALPKGRKGTQPWKGARAIRGAFRMGAQ
jgi:hypothetical protein